MELTQEGKLVFQFTGCEHILAGLTCWIGIGNVTARMADVQAHVAAQLLLHVSNDGFIFEETNLHFNEI